MTDHMKVNHTKIPQAVRDKVLVEVHHQCVRCFSDAPEVDIHHIVPVAKGGTNEEENLVVLCPTCHRLAHRYHLTARQLNLYKRNALFMWSFGDSAPMWKKYPPHVRLGIDETPDLLRELLSCVEGWYNQVVMAASAIKHSGEKPDKVTFEYENTRMYLPHIVAIRNVLEDRDGFRELVSDIDALLAKLTYLNPDSTDYSPFCRPLIRLFDRPDPTTDDLKDLQSLLQLIADSVYSHTSGGTLEEQQRNMRSPKQSTMTPNKPDAGDG